MNLVRIELAAQRGESDNVLASFHYFLSVPWRLGVLVATICVLMATNGEKPSQAGERLFRKSRLLGKRTKIGALSIYILFAAR